MKWLLAVLLTGLLFFSLGTNTYKKGNVGEVGTSGVVFTENSESITNHNNGWFEFKSDTSGEVQIFAADSDANADFRVRAGGTGQFRLGGNQNASVTITSDGGVVFIDGYVQADKGPFITLASGNLTANTIHHAPPGTGLIP